MLTLLYNLVSRDRSPRDSLQSEYAREMYAKEGGRESVVARSRRWWWQGIESLVCSPDVRSRPQTSMPVRSEARLSTQPDTSLNLNGPVAGLHRTLLYDSIRTGRSTTQCLHHLLPRDRRQSSGIHAHALRLILVEGLRPSGMSHQRVLPR